MEAYASAVAVVRRATEALAEQPGASALRDRLRSRGEISARDVFDAAAQGDAVAARVVEQTAFYLAVGAMNAMHVIDPDLVVFGGGMIAAGEGFLERIRHHVRELAFPVPAENTLIRYAQLGIDAGFIGAAGCGRQLVKPGVP